MIDWFKGNDTLLWWLAAASLVTFVATLVVVPVILARLPVDYFANRGRHRADAAERHPVVALMVIVLKNTVGGLFVIVGSVMFCLPGQGLLTMVVGLWLMDFPGKYRIERWLIERRAVFSVANWIRAKVGRPPFTLAEASAAATCASDDRGKRGKKKNTDE